MRTQKNINFIKANIFIVTLTDTYKTQFLYKVYVYKPIHNIIHIHC